MLRIKPSQNLDEYFVHVNSLLPFKEVEKKHVISDFILNIKESISESKEEQTDFLVENPRIIAKNISMSNKWTYTITSFKTRLLSYLVDFSLSIALGIITEIFIVGLIYLFDNTFFRTTRSFLPAFTIFLALITTPLIVHTLYFIVLETYFSTTVGKKVMGLYVVDRYGLKITSKQAFLRSLSKLFPIFLLLDLISGITQNNNHQRFLDTLSQTYVIKINFKEKRNILEIILGFIFLTCTFFILPFFEVHFTSLAFFINIYYPISFGLFLGFLGLGLIISNCLIDLTNVKKQDINFVKRNNNDRNENNFRSSSSTCIIEDYLNQVDKILPVPKEQKKSLLKEISKDLFEELNDSTEKNPSLILGYPREVAKDISLSHTWRFREVGFKLRFIAFFIDSFLSCGIAFLLFILINLSLSAIFPWYLRTQNDVLTIQETFLFLSTLLFALILMSIYSIMLEGKYSTTFGKRLFRLVVIDNYGLKITKTQAITRNLSKFFILFLLIDTLIGLIHTKGNQRSLDELAQTFVIKISK